MFIPNETGIPAACQKKDNRLSRLAFADDIYLHRRVFLLPRFRSCTFFIGMLLALFGLVSQLPVAAQPTEADEGILRYSFAETYVGVDASVWGGEVLPSMSIGGTHFWGASDIYVRFPVGTVAAADGRFSPGIETSFHWYPIPLQKQSIRPYIGAGWTIASYKEDDGPDLTKHLFPLKAGVSLRHDAHLVEVGISYLAGDDIQYPTAPPPTTAPADMPRLGLSLGYKYLFDTTLHAADRYKAEQAAAARRGQAGLLDNWGIILSPSSVFPIGTGDLPTHLSYYPPTITYEVGLSYYLYKPDLSLQVIYRPSTMKQKAYGDKARLAGQSLRFEGLKFFPLDYYGFTPYVGLGIGYERWQDERTWTEDERTSGWAPSFAFGWEIRPTRNESFYLRQNMRYTATRAADAPVDVFDVSFIQFIYYFGR